MTTLLVFLLFVFLLAILIRGYVLYHNLRKARQSQRCVLSPPPPSQPKNKNNKNDSTHDGSKPRTNNNFKTMVVLGSGGHTSEMLAMLLLLSEGQEKEEQEAESSTEPLYWRKNLVFVLASTDTTSYDRLLLQLQKQRHENGPPPLIQVHKIPRAREVGQSYLSSVGTTLYAFLHSFRVFLQERPQLLICNGPGTCLPLCFVAFLCRFCALTRTQIVFVESYCRVHTLSLTGKLLYPLVDLFCVHWPYLQQHYPQSVLLSVFVKHDLLLPPYSTTTSAT